MTPHDEPSNPNIFLLPDLGEGLEEAELIEWCVTEGQAVKDLDVLARMETAKAVVDVTSPREGVIEHLHGQPGETVKVGAPLISFRGAAGAPSTAGDGRAHRAPVGSADASSAMAEEDAVPSDEMPEQESGGEDSGTVVGALGEADDEAARSGAGKVRAAPAVRRLARDLGVDIAGITGTGIGGRITSRDVQAEAAKLPPTVAPVPQPPSVRAAPALPKQSRPKEKEHPARGGGSLWPSKQGTGLPPRRIPMLERKETPSIPPGQDSIRISFRGVRRIIAQHLRHSIGHAVHFTIMDDADITALDEQRRRFTEIAREKMTILPFIASAVCRVLSGRDEPKFNRLNSTVDDAKQEIIQHRAVHLGIATDTEEGLMVPVIKDADQLGVLELGRKIQELAKKARERNIKRDELVGSTFTISNFGSLHGRYGTPIINYPEACILAVGRAREGVVVRDHMIGIGMLLPLSLSADHRVIDGGTAAQALARVIELLQNPQELLPSKR
jgi:pyruvate dehydrogenase E2 component (dihydrolipoamide acetyltransferase)